MMGTLSLVYRLATARFVLLGISLTLLVFGVNAQELRPRRVGVKTPEPQIGNPHVRSRIVALDEETDADDTTIPDMCLYLRPGDKPQPLVAQTEGAPSLFSAHGLRGVSAAAGAYTATAYDLRGTCASGLSVRRGIIAADPRILPLGTRVYLSAGPYSGTYLVADTGGVIKGRRIDIWMGSHREAINFGRRPVSITVLGYDRIHRPRSTWRRIKRGKFRSRSRARR